MCTGPYEIPNVKVDAYAVYTNNIPGGAFRGFGGPQGAFAAESQINKLAEALNLDPVEIRMRNIVKEGSILSVGTPLPKGVSMPQVVEKCAERAGWQHSKQKGGWQKTQTDQKSHTCAEVSALLAVLKMWVSLLVHPKIVGLQSNCMVLPKLIMR